MRKEIALVDANNFFVGCEQLMNPELLDKPVCVLSNNDGCVVARSNEAKELGVKMGMPLFMAKKEFPQVIYLSGNMKFYHDISLRLRNILSNYSPEIEVYSIDEAFLNLTGMQSAFQMDYDDLILKIKEDVYKELGIKVSIGLANSKILAKIATGKAKKSDGVCRIKFEDINSQIKSILVEDIWGIGKNTARELKKYGIFTALDVISYDDDFYKRILGKRGLELRHELMGESVILLDFKPSKPKSIQRTSSFPEFLRDKDSIRKTLYSHLHLACSKMRQLNLEAKELFVMLRTKDFRVFTEKMLLEKQTSSEYVLNSKVDELLDKIYLADILYRSSGVYVSGLNDASINQLYLTDGEMNIKAEKIGKLWDKFEKKYGRHVFGVGALPRE